MDYSKVRKKVSDFLPDVYEVDESNDMYIGIWRDETGTLHFEILEVIVDNESQYYLVDWRGTGDTLIGTDRDSRVYRGEDEEELIEEAKDFFS